MDQYTTGVNFANYFKKDSEEGVSQGDEKSRWTLESTEDPSDVLLFERRNKNYSTLFKFDAENNEGWSIENISNKKKDSSLQFIIEGKILDKKTRKEIRDKFSFQIKIDEFNIQSVSSINIHVIVI